MTNRPASAPRHSEAGRYEIRLKGHLDAHWTSWFEGLSVSCNTDGTTVISGPIADQAALHGVLQRIRDLGLPLLSVARLGHGGELDTTPRRRRSAAPPRARESD